MHYQPYFNLSLFHDYYQKRTCPDFTVAPTHDCQRILKGYRLVFKSSMNGFQLLIPVESNEKFNPFLPLEQLLIFTFLLRLKKTDFTTFTQLDSDYQIGKSFYVYSNETIKDGESLELKQTIIQQEKLTQPKAQQSPLEARCAEIAELQFISRNQIFGVIEIHNRDFLKSTDQQRGFKTTFAAKAQTWKYYLITDQSTDAQSFSIQSKDTNGDALAFALDKSNDGDGIKAKIKQRFPDSQTIVLCSKKPVACRELGRPNLQLFKEKPKKESNTSQIPSQNKPLISNLPNPSNQSGICVINLLKEV